MQVAGLGVELPLLLFLSLSYTFSVISLSFCFAETVQSALSSSGEIALYVSIYSVYLWEEVSSGTSCATILDPKIFPSDFKIKLKHFHNL